MNEQNNKFDINRVIADLKAIIINPAGYYQAMPKSGGFGDPLIFIVVMAAATGIISAVLSVFGSHGGMLAIGLGAIIIMPIGAVIGAFIGAGILYVVWKLMGSEQSYETAFRCLAAVTAIYPITALLSLVPYLGSAVGILWSTYLMIEASVAVHARERKTAAIVFGVIGALLLVSNISSEHAARNMAEHMEEMGSMFEDYQDLPPEEAGKKMGEFLKGLEQGMEKNQ